MKEQNINASSTKTDALIDFLTDRGLVENLQISDEKIRQAAKDKKRKKHHNTLLMLQHYRNITWALECFPSKIAEELEQPMHDLDALLSLINNEIDMDNVKLENRLKSIQKSRLLLDRLNEAISIVRLKPGNGELMYCILYETFITQEKLTHLDIIYRLGISSRHYYRIRQQAISLLSIRLWAAPTSELDAWLEALTLLDIY